jgi:putative addiction module killer protein
MEYTLLATPEFTDWLDRLRDSRARARIQARIDRFALGNPGDIKFVAERLWELRVDYGPGYRVYFVRRGRQVIVLLAGGDKRSQGRDIAKSLELARNYGS